MVDIDTTNRVLVDNDNKNNDNDEVESTAAQKLASKKSQRSDARGKEDSDAAKQAQDADSAKMTARKKEDEDRRKAESDREEQRQAAKKALEDADQAKIADMQKSLQELYQKLLDRADARTEMVTEPGAHARSRNRNLTHANRVYRDKEYYAWAFIGWASGKANKIYNKEYEVESRIKYQKDARFQRKRDEEDEDDAAKISREFFLRHDRYKAEDAIDDTEYRADLDVEEAQKQDKQTAKDAEKKKLEIQKQQQAASQAPAPISHTAGVTPNNGSAELQTQFQSQLDQVDKDLEKSAANTKEKIKQVAETLKYSKAHILDTLEQDAIKTNRAYAATAKKAQEERDEKERAYKAFLKSIKKELKEELERIEKDYAQKLATLEEAYYRKKRTSRYKIDDISALPGVATRTYSEIITENEPPSKPREQADKSTRAIHAYIKKMLGKTPWIERCAVGEVLSVNKAGHRCTVRIGSSPSYDVTDKCTTINTPITTERTVTTTVAIFDKDGHVTGTEEVDEVVSETDNIDQTICIPNFTLNDQGHVVLGDVRYGATHPKKGESYVVRIPAVYKDKETHYDPGRPWIKVPENGRWLYRKVRNDTIMQRWEWPPPGPSDPWEPELVHENLDDETKLLGPYKKETDAVEVVLWKFISADGTVDGSEGMEPIAVTPELKHFPNMGFDDTDFEWSPSPAWTRIQASSNDSETFAGWDWEDTVQTNPGSVDESAIIEVVEVIHCCLPFPFLVIDPRTGEDVTPIGPFCAGAYKYAPIPQTYLGDPNKQLMRLLVNGVKGIPPSLKSSYTYRNNPTNLKPPRQLLGGIGWPELQPLGGCHWIYITIFPFLVVWDSIDDPGSGTGGIKYLNKSYPAYRTASSTSILSGRFVSSVPLSFAWGNEAAYIFQDFETYKFGPNWNDWSARDPRLYLEGTFGHQEITFPGFDPHHEEFDVNFISIENIGASDGEAPILFGELWNFDTDVHTMYRWSGEWSKLEGVSTVVAVSRDSTDLLGRNASHKWVYSQDSGLTWTECAPLNPFHFGPHNGLEFVDEL